VVDGFAVVGSSAELPFRRVFGHTERNVPDIGGQGRREEESCCIERATQSDHIHDQISKQVTNRVTLDAVHSVPCAYLGSSKSSKH
jgi:hypothetical protein